MKNKELLDKWDNMKPHERNDLIFYDVLDRMPLNTAPNEFGGFGTIPRYSEDISAAWEVITKMKEKNWWIALNAEDKEWNAMFYWDPHQQAYECDAETAPEAICKAALLVAFDHPGEE